MKQVLIVDDKPLLRDSIASTLRRAGFAPIAADGGDAALRVVHEQKLAAVVTDLKMPGMDGVALLQRVRQLSPGLPVVLMTAYASVDTAVRALKLGAFDYIQKPFEPEELVAVIAKAAAVSHAACVGPAHVMRTLLGQSPAMQAVRQQITTIASGRGDVLITGESGTGKELAAQAIHAASGRAGRPMPCVNCAALHESLLESELFGHERGAFTGADRPRRGRFELADGGTLLLDEISETRPALQAKLLRVLQERSFERVGGERTLDVDVRVIATSNRDLAAMVRRGEFRGDLYFRLHVLPLHLPPLRERPGDIPLLANHFLSPHGLNMSDAAIELLLRHDWPGNVRELEHLCERAAVFATGPTVGPDLVGPWLRSGGHEPVGAMRGRTLEEIERQTILATLGTFNGHRQRTAQALGIGVRTLGLKLKRWKERSLVAGSV